MTDEARERALAENLRRSEVMAEPRRFSQPPCTRAHHREWVILDDHGRPFALAGSVCMATVAIPSLEVEPGARQVALPDGWEDYDED